MSDSDPTIQDVLEAMSSFAEHVEDRFNKADERFVRIEDKLVQMDNKIDSGFASIRSEIRELRDELISKIDRLEKRTAEDTDATMQDYLKLKKRVDVLERQVQQMQLAHA